MASERDGVIWIPLALTVASLLLSLGLTKYWDALPSWVSIMGIVAALALFGWAIYIARKTRDPARPQAGVGGRAVAHGEDLAAIGGQGGDAGRGHGGDGGSASARGKRSRAKGGDGGRG